MSRTTYFSPPLDKNDDRPQVFMQLMPLFKHTFALPLSSEHKKEGCRMEWLFYNNSSTSCLHCFIFRNTLHLVLVPYLFKIDASLKNSLSLQCTSLYFWHFSVCELSLPTSGFRLLPVSDRSGREHSNNLYHYSSSIISNIKNIWTTKPPVLQRKWKL